MSKSDQHRQDNDEENYTYKIVSSELDEFLDEWRDELYRKKCILVLNDDCFYKIFSFLRAIDLCAVAETCHDFRRLSADCFERRNKFFRLEPISIHGSRSVLTLNDAKCLLRNFGKFITKLSIESNTFRDNGDWTRLLPLLDRYCLQLQDLEVNMTDWPTTGNLHRLVFRQLCGHSAFALIELGSILEHCGQLKQLELDGFTWDEMVCPEKSFESLEFLSLRKCRIPCTDVIRDLLSKNCQLKRIKFSC